MKTSALPRRAQVERQEACARERSGEREGEREVARMDGDRVDREEGERDPGHRRRQPVHVVEQVEGVRDADEPDDGDRVADELVVDELHVRPGAEHDRRSADLGGELRERRQAEEVVGEAGQEDERAPGVDADEGSATA